MRTIPIGFLFLFLLVYMGSCDAGRGPGKQEHPSIYLVSKKAVGFTSLEDFDDLEKDKRTAAFIEKLLSEAGRDLQYPYIDPTTDVEGRNPVHLKHANVSYDMAQLVSERLSRSAFLFLYTGDHKYKDLIMRQIEALYDTLRWPMWCDQAHVNIEPHLDIRTCRISMWVALAYNWMYDHLTEEERSYIVDGLDRRAIQPFWLKQEKINVSSRKEKRPSRSLSNRPGMLLFLMHSLSRHIWAGCLRATIPPDWVSPSGIRWNLLK